MYNVGLSERTFSSFEKNVTSTPYLIKLTHIFSLKWNKMEMSSENYKGRTKSSQANNPKG